MRLSDLLVDITEKACLVRRDPEFKTELGKKVLKYLQTESNKESLFIEHPKRTKRVMTKRIKQKYNDLTSCWVWGLKNFPDNLDENFILEVGKRIDSDLDNEFGFRNDGLTWIKGGSVIPPNPLKVPVLLDELIKNVNSNELHPVIAASYFHLKFVYIHPFKDGNGRTSRMIQNLLLHRAGIPPPVTRMEERGLYISVVQNGLKGMQRRIQNGEYDWTKRSPEEHVFHELMAAKIMSSLERIVDALKEDKYRINVVKLGRGGVNQFNALRNRLRRQVASLPKPGKVEKIKGKNELYLVGRFNPNQLDELVSSYSGLLRYSIRKLNVD